jgi:hypothetical protein
MRRFARILIAATVAIAARANAQQCTGGAAALDACRKAIDIVDFLTPQYAAALAGGNPTLAQSGALGGLGKVAVAVRSTRVMGELPTIGDQGFSTNGPSKASYHASGTLIPALSVDMAFGLFRGFDAGRTYVGGVDVLLSGTYMSELSHASLGVALEGSNTNFGFGARVGLVEETPTLPGVAVTYLKRDMPRFAIAGVSDQGNATTTAPGSITASSLLVTATSIRLTVGKRLGAVDLSGGVGQDKYAASADIRAVVNAAAPTGSQVATGMALMDMTRTNIFAGGALNVMVFKFVGEIGMATGGAAPAALNDFGSAPNATRTYFTLAIRIGF